MTKRLMPIIENPQESQQLRGLLEAGRDARVKDYDFEQGLRRHLAQVEAGAPMPHWAEGLQAGGVAAVRTGMGPLLAWIGAPIVTASVVAAYLFTSGATESPRATGVPPAAPVMPSTLDRVPLEPAPAEAAPDPTAETATSPEPTAPDERGSARETAPERSHRHAVAGTRERATAADRGSASTRSQQGAASDRAAELDRTSAPAGAKDRSGTAAALGTTTAPSQPKVAPVAVEANGPAERPSTEPDGQPARPDEATEAAAAPAKPEPTRLDDARLEREMGMLAMAQRVLHSDPQRAWKLARQGEAEFPGSMFTEERQQLLLLSLVQLGRLDEAKRLAEPYLARYPNGPFSERVRRALATGRVQR
jgi:hypothetical protein